MPIIYLIIFIVVSLIVIYFFNSAIVRGFKLVNFKEALLYITAVAMLGVIAEVVIGNLYFGLFGRPLWEYTVYPLHDGYTSLYAPFLWGTYGFQIYLIHDTFKSKGITSLHFLIPFICIEAIIFEAVINLGFLAVFGQYIFYYFPDDLFHLTSVQTLPFYLLAGFVITATIKFMQRAPEAFIVLNLFITSLVVGVL